MMYSKLRAALDKAARTSEDWATDGWTMLFPASDDAGNSSDAQCDSLIAAKAIAANPGSEPGVDARAALDYWSGVDDAGQEAARLGDEAWALILDAEDEGAAAEFEALTSALDLARQASRLEAEYGDDPTWSQVVKDLAQASAWAERPCPVTASTPGDQTNRDS